MRTAKFTAYLRIIDNQGEPISVKKVTSVWASGETLSEQLTEARKKVYTRLMGQNDPGLLKDWNDQGAYLELSS